MNKIVLIAAFMTVVTYLRSQPLYLETFTLTAQDTSQESPQYTIAVEATGGEPAYSYTLNNGPVVTDPAANYFIVPATEQSIRIHDTAGSTSDITITSIDSSLRSLNGQIKQGSHGASLILQVKANTPDTAIKEITLTNESGFNISHKTLASSTLAFDELQTGHYTLTLGETATQSKNPQCTKITFDIINIHSSPAEKAALDDCEFKITVTSNPVS